MALGLSWISSMNNRVFDTDNEEPVSGSSSLHSATHSGHQHRPQEAGQVTADYNDTDTTNEDPSFYF